MLVCPSTSETTSSRVPWVSMSEAPEWRSSCGCQCPRPACSHNRANECEKLSGSIGVPTSEAKISPCSCQSDPAASWASACRARVRLLFGDRDAPEVAQRSLDEGIGEHTIAVKIEHALVQQITDL